jgi:hypothetical protein
MRCLLVLLPLQGCLGYESYLQKLRERYCEEMAVCNPDFECVVPSVDDTGYTTDIAECDFDAKNGRDCLKGTWTCAGPLGEPAFQYPVGPAACSEVCAIPSDE